MMRLFITQLSFLVLMASSWANTPIDTQANIIRNRLTQSPLRCGLLTAPISAADPTSLNNSAQLRQAVLPDIIQKMGIDCLKSLAQNLAFKANSDEVTRKQRQQMLDEITKRGNKVDKIPELYCYHSPTGLEEILRLAQETKKINECRPLKPGQWTVIEEHTGPTGIGANYALAQTDAKKWVATLSLDVKTANGVAGPDMFKRIKECMAAVDKHMKGPQGEILSINILTEADAKKIPSSKRPPTVEIDIQPVGARSNSGAYAADITCSTIVHEVLHLLGLCDEYDGKDDGYECRAVPTGESIMKSHTGVFADVVPRQLQCDCLTDDCHKMLQTKSLDIIRMNAYSWTMGPADYEFRDKYCETAKMLSSQPLVPTQKNQSLPVGDTGMKLVLYDVTSYDLKKMYATEIVCHCPAGDEACLRVRKDTLLNMNNYVPEGCPSGTKETLTAFGASGSMQITDYGFKLPLKVPNPGSLLLPVHFSRIIGGACEDVTTQYNQCAKWAYKGSKDTNNCANRPVYCATDDWQK